MENRPFLNDEASTSIDNLGKLNNQLVEIFSSIEPIEFLKRLKEELEENTKEFKEEQKLAEQKECESQQVKLLAKSPLAERVVTLNEQIKVLTLQLEQTISEIAQQPEKYDLKQDGLCHVLVKALHDKTDINTLGQQLKKMTVSTYLREMDNQYGFSPLHWLMLKDDTNLSDYLVSKGFCFDQRDKLGLLPTHLASYFGKNRFLIHRLNKVTQFNEVEIKFVDATQNQPQTMKFVLNELHLSIMGRQLDRFRCKFLVK